MARFDKAEKDFWKEVNQKITDLVFDTHREIILKTPVAQSVPSDEWSEGHTGGNLRRSIVIEQPNEGEWVIGTNVHYAEYVEMGTPPHIIRAKNKKSLKWGRGKNSKFAKEVMHPGTEGVHMFELGVAYFEQELPKRLR